MTPPVFKYFQKSEKRFFRGICLFAEFLSNFSLLAAGHFSLRTFAGDKARRAVETEQERRGLPQRRKRGAGRVSDLPLGAIAAAQAEKDIQLPSVHRRQRKTAAKQMQQAAAGICF